MCRNRLHRWKFGLACVLLMLAGPASAFAGWMGFRNDTNQTLVVQELVNLSGSLRPGKPQKLSSGDVIRDTQVGSGGQRHFLIFDAKNLNQPIFSGNFPTPKATENILYSIKLDNKGGVKIESSTSSASTPKK